MKRALLIVLLAVVAAPAEAARDIRVVLDLSRSMKRNDPGRMAILSTILLHDLAQPNPSLGDSFKVIPFDLHWRWIDRGAPAPLSTQRPIEVQLGHRVDFVQTLQKLPYDADMTYFYPGIAAALQDLEQSARGTYDVRTIVLITDGVPEPATRDVELQHIRNELVPRLEQHGIRLYVLAFGGEAARNRDFFTEMVRSSGGASLGDVFIDPNGTELLSNMLQLFSRSFGFSPDVAHPVPGTTTLNLEASNTPERVAVAVLSAQPRPPSLRLTPPPGSSGSVSAPDGPRSASAPGGSYSLLWLLSPSPGAYGFDSDAVRGAAAVVRPTRLALELLPAPPHHQVQRTLASTPFPMHVVVHSSTGAQGDPGDVALSFRTFGERVPQPSGGGSSYVWESARTPPAGPGRVTSRGREYDIVAEFREHPETPERVYVGYVEAEARRGEAVVGALAGAHAQRVEVHPLLGISPLPLGAHASPRALGRREHACTTFTFQLNAGRLPHPDRPSYPVRAALAAGDPATLDHELSESSFTLDGIALDVDNKPAPQPSAWYTGRSLSPAELLGAHELCVRIGKPTEGNPALPVELQLRTTLLDDPYDEFRVIAPFDLKVLVAPPTLYEKWRLFFFAGMALLILVGLSWYLRDRPTFPGDLGYAVGREDSTAAPGSRPLEQPESASVFAWVAESPVLAPGEDRPLGYVRPARAELFRFRPARGVDLEPVEPNEVIALRRGLATLAVQRTYRLRTPRGPYVFRLEYR
jgi:hypothetical protein